MKHTHQTINTYVYLHAKTLARKKKKKHFAISEKNISRGPRLFITYPKAYAKETPFMDLLLNSHIYVIIKT